MANYTYKEIVVHFKSIKEEIVAYREVFLKNVETFSELKHREEGHYDQATYDKVDYDIQLTVAILMYITTGKVPSKFKKCGVWKFSSKCLSMTLANILKNSQSSLNL